jgi:hypothetical protein
LAEAEPDMTLEILRELSNGNGDASGAKEVAVIYARFISRSGKKKLPTSSANCRACDTDVKSRVLDTIDVITSAITSDTRLPLPKPASSRGSLRQRAERESAHAAGRAR